MREIEPEKATRESQIVDRHGEPYRIAEPKDPPHKFGFFKIPDDVHIKNLTTFDPRGRT